MPHTFGKIASLLCVYFVTVLTCVCAPQSNGPEVLPPRTTAEINEKLQIANERIARSGNDAGSDARIGPDDLLDVSVFEAPEMNRTLRVSSSGEISFELLGDVQVAGKTPREVESILQEMLRRTLPQGPARRNFRP